MYSHENCTHPRTKVARAACRREHATNESSQSRHPAGKGERTSKATRERVRGPRLPSIIAPKIKPLVDAAKAKGLKVRLSTDPPDGVEQAFVITNPKKPDCELIAEAFQAATKGRSGRTEYWHVEEGRARQLSRQRAIEDLDLLAKA